MTTIRAMEPADWPAVEAIYRAGIATGQATFESEPPSWEAFDAGKVRDVRLVAVDDDGSVIGWVAASPVSARPAYRGVIEHSIYISPDWRGHGIGRDLLAAFLKQTAAAGYWTVQSSIFRENTASARLHERAGFRTVGHRDRIALMGYGPHEGEWRDTVLIEWRRPTD